MAAFSRRALLRGAAGLVAASAPACAEAAFPNATGKTWVTPYLQAVVPYSP